MNASRQDHRREHPEAALPQARAAFDRCSWREAFTQLAAADERAALGPEDLRRLAESAYLSGRDEVAEDAWARAHQAFLDRGDVRPAVRCAFWLGMVLLVGRGADVRGGGWITRAHRLVEERGPRDCAEHGYLRLPAALAELNGGDPGDAHAMFSQAAAAGKRFDEADLTVLGLLGQGQALIRMGEAQRGMDLLDEILVTIEAGRVSPIAAGIVFCAGILACQQVLDVRRAQQWTAVLSRWCDRQPGLVPFRGQCLVHRSQLAQLSGDWSEAVAEVQRACEWPDLPGDVAGMAHYQRAELHRLRGEHAAAEAAFQQATGLGHDPQPGLALLRLDQGRTDAAAAAIRRVVAETEDWYPRVVDEVRAPGSRAEVLQACVEIMLAAGDAETADAAVAELEHMAASLQTGLVSAMAAHVRGAALLTQGEPGAALEALSQAQECWMDLQAPYEAARVRVLIARALVALGDEDTAAIEAATAVEVFEELGAAPDLARLDASTADAVGGLTPREVEVIQLVATGRTNREIAEELVISEKTVARHLHNVFTKLDLPNRSAATAYAYEHKLVS